MLLKPRNQQLLSSCSVLPSNPLRSEESFKQYFSEMPWLAVPYSDEARRSRLNRLYGIQGISTAASPLSLNMHVFAGLFYYLSIALLRGAANRITAQKAEKHPSSTCDERLMLVIVLVSYTVFIGRCKQQEENSSSSNNFLINLFSFGTLSTTSCITFKRRPISSKSSK